MESPHATWSDGRCNYEAWVTKLGPNMFSATVYNRTLDLIGEAEMGGWSPYARVTLPHGDEFEVGMRLGSGMDYPPIVHSTAAHRVA